MKEIVVFLLSAATVFGGLAVLFSFLASWLPLADSVNHFRVHLIGGLAVLILPLALIKAWRLAGFALIVALVGGSGLSPAFPVMPHTVPEIVSSDLKLLQLNTYFRNVNPANVVKLIEHEQPDVVTLQEITTKNVMILRALEKDYPHQIDCRFASVGRVAIISRLPRDPEDGEACRSQTGLALMRVISGDEVVTIGTVHLHWPFPFQQGQQINDILPFLENLDGSFVLAGDFNAAPWSHAVDRIAQASGTIVAQGYRATLGARFEVFGIPMGLPLDHVLVSEELAVRHIRVGPNVSSDHRPVIAHIYWK